MTDRSWMTQDKEPWIYKLFSQGVIHYRLILAAILGIILMVVGGYIDKPASKNNQEVDKGIRESAQSKEVYSSYEEKLENKLSILLSQVKGAGKVTVSVILENSSFHQPAKNITKETKTIQEKDNTGSLRTTTEIKESEQILFSKENGAEQPVFINEIQPKIKGVLVISEGAYDSIVKANLIKGVEIGLGLPSYKVTVLTSKTEVQR